MRKIFTIVALAISVVVLAQNDSTKVEKDTIEGWQFTTIDSVAITPIKDQNRSSTCWAFSTLGFLECVIR